MPTSIDYDPFAEDQDKKKTAPGLPGAEVSDFAPKDLADLQINLTPPKIDTALPKATDYDPFQALGRGSLEQTQPAQPRQPAATPKTPNLGLFGESFGVYTPEDQKAWLAGERQKAQNSIADAQTKLSRIKQLGAGLTGPDVVLDYDTKKATQDIKAAQDRLRELSAMERGEIQMPTKSALRSASENFPRSVAETVLSIPEMVGIIKGYIQPGAVDDESLLNWSRDAKNYVAQLFPGDPARQNEFGQILATGLGSMVSFYGAGILSRLAKLSVPAQTAIISALGGTATGTQGFEEATAELQKARADAAASGDQAAIDDYDRLLKTFGYSVVGLSEAAPIARTLSRAAAPRTRFGQRLLQGAESGLEEATQETASQLAQNAISRGTTDPNRDLTQGVAESAAAGGALGGLFGFMLPGRFRGPQNQPQPGQPQIPLLPGPQGPRGGGGGSVLDVDFENVPTPQAPLAIPATNAPERTALRAEMSRQLRAMPALSGQAEQFLAALDEPGPTQNVVQAALQKARDTGRLSAVANELIQTMRPQIMAQPSPAPQVQEQFAAPGTSARVRTSPLSTQTQTQVQTPTQTPFAEPFALPSTPISEGEISPALGGREPLAPELDELGYYSQALETARNLPQAVGAPEQMLAQLEKGGTKEAEIRATNLDRYLLGDQLAQQRRQLIDLRTQVNALQSELKQKQPEVTPERRAEIEAELARLQPILATNDDEFRRALQQSNLPRRVNRDDLVDYLTQNRVRLQQSRYGGREIGTYLIPRNEIYHDDGTVDIEYQDRDTGDNFVVNIDGAGDDITIQGPGGVFIPVGEPEEWQSPQGRAKDAIEDWIEQRASVPDVTGPAKWESYSLDPGNPTYRANVVYLPTPPSAPQFDPSKVKIERRRQSATQGSATISYDGRVLLQGADDSDNRPDSYWIDYARRVFEQGDPYNRLENMQGAFRQGHFDEPNVIAHYRTQELETTDGRTSLNGDEFQSDWGQKIREGGARDEEKIARLEKELEELKTEYRKNYGDTRKFVSQNFDEQAWIDLSWKSGSLAQSLEQMSADLPLYSEERKTGFDLANKFMDISQKQDLLEAEIRTAKAATPAHPLVRTTDQWLTTTLRKFIKDAVDAGVDGVTITPGQVQIDRYPRLATQGITGLAYAPDDRYGLGDLVIQQNNGRWFAIKQGIPAHELRDYIGRDLSEQLLKQEPEDTEFGYYAHVLRELPDIEIGGEGMRATYDKIYPRALAKLLQKMDKSIKPERVKLLPHKISQQTDILERMKAEGKTFDDYPYNLISDKEKEVVNQTFTFFPITDKVRQKVREEGQPLFAIGGTEEGGEEKPYRVNDSGYVLFLPFEEKWGDPRFNPADRERALQAYRNIKNIDVRNAPWADLVDAVRTLNEVATQLYYFHPDSEMEVLRGFAETRSYMAELALGQDSFSRFKAPLFAERMKDEGSDVADLLPFSQQGREAINHLLSVPRKGVHDLLAYGREQEPGPRTKPLTPGGKMRSGFYFQSLRVLPKISDEVFYQGGQAVINAMQQAGVKAVEINHFRFQDFANRKPVSRADFEERIQKRAFDFRTKMSLFNPENYPLADYEMGTTRAFTGPRIPGRGVYFERPLAFPKRLRGGEDFAPGHFVNPHWDEILPSTWASWRGSIRDIPGWGKMVIGEEGQNDYIQGALTERRERVSPEHYFEVNKMRPQYNEARQVAFRIVDNIDNYFGDNTVIPELSNLDTLVRRGIPIETWEIVVNNARNEIKNLNIDLHNKRSIDRNLDNLIKLIRENEQFFDEKSVARYERSLTPESPLDETYVRTMVRELINIAVRQEADSVALSTSQTTARIQYNPEAAHFYDQQLKPALQKELRRWTGDSSLELEQVKLPHAQGIKKKQPYTVWAAKLPEETRLKIKDRGLPMFALAGHPQLAMDSLQSGMQSLQDWQADLADFYSEGGGPGPDAAMQAVSAIISGPHRSMEAMRGAMQQAGFPEDIPDSLVAQGLLAANFLAAPRTKDPVDPIYALRGFYSPAIRAVENAKQDKATPEQWKKVLSGPGVRQEEIRWISVIEWLDEQASLMVDRPGSNLPKSEKTLSRDDVLNFMRAHQYELEQHILRDEADETEIESESEQDIDHDNDQMTEEERQDWINERAREIANELERESVNDQMRDWVSENDPDDYETEIAFEEYDDGQEELLLNVERIHREAMEEFTRTGTIGGQLPLPGIPMRPLTFAQIAEGVLPQEVFELWRDGYIGWTAQLTHPGQRADEDIERGEIFETRADAEQAAEDRLEQIQADFPNERDSYAELLYENDFAYEWNQARQQAESEFEEKHGETAVRGGFRSEVLWKRYAIKGGRHYQEMLIRFPQIAGRYSSPHFHDHEIVYVRFDIREDENGNKILFIHEIQSDLHQRARKFGYGSDGRERAQSVLNNAGFTPESKKNLIDASRREEFLGEEYNRYRQEGHNEASPIIQTVLNELSDITKKISEINKNAQKNFTDANTYISRFPYGAPEAPMTGNAWWELAMKVMFQHAVEKNYAGVALTNPEQINEATSTPMHVDNKFYGNNIPKFVSKYVKKWGSNQEQRALSGMREKRKIVLRDNYTIDNFIKWLNALKSQANYYKQIYPSSFDGTTAHEMANEALAKIMAPNFNGDIESIVNSDDRFLSLRTDTIPALWRKPDGSYSTAYVPDGVQSQPDTEAPYQSIWEPIKNPFWPITDAMRKDLSGEGTGQPYAMGQAQVIRGAKGLLAAGRSVAIPDNVWDAIFSAVSPHRAALPQGLPIGYLSRIEPVENSSSRVNAHFTTDSGRTHVMEIDRNQLFNLRAFYQPPNGQIPPGVFFVRHTASGEVEKGLIGEVRHEAIHALRRNGLIPAGIWSRLVSHAKQLQVLNVSLGEYLDVVRGESKQEHHIHPLGHVYDAYYGGRTDYDEMINQEAVAHMAELYSHGAWADDEIEPVARILDDIFIGKYSGNAGPETQDIDVAYALQPAESIKNDPAFKRWFGDSKVVDENGEPLVVYHGTDRSEFEDFSADEIGTGIDASPFVGGVGMLGRGFYFTPSERKSFDYGERSVPVYLSMRNPLVIGKDTQFDSIIEAVSEIAGKDVARTEIMDALQAAGYDGIIKRDQFYPELDEYVAFEPTQIKSVFNAGQFDPNNPDILAALAGIKAKAADQMALARAKDMKVGGKSEQEIWRETGWIEGLDGSWRFEIPDLEAKFKITPEKIKALGQSGKEVNLESILDHPLLYKNYPQLRKVKIEFSNKEMFRTGLANYYRRKKDLRSFFLAALPSTLITLGLAPNPENPKGFQDEKDFQELIEVLMHEIQHKIQFIEGFATGTRPERQKEGALERLRRQQLTKLDWTLIYANPKAVKVINGIGKLLDLHQETKDKQEKSKLLKTINSESNRLARMLGIQTYNRFGGEVESMEIERRISLPIETLREQPPNLTGDYPREEIILRDARGYPLGKYGPGIRRLHARAEQMEKAKVDPEIIRNQTGWFRDPNGRWAFRDNENLRKILDSMEEKV